MGTTRENVAALRAFNRFHTNVIGALHSGLVNSPYTLTEARVLYELAQAPVTEVRRLRDRLDIDAGYLSRILARFAAEDLINRRRAAHDARRQLIELTRSGRRSFASLDRRADRAAAELLTRLSDTEQTSLLNATRTVAGLLGSVDGQRPPGHGEIKIRRASEPGDFGWIVQRHGELYAAEYGWGPDFEALVARIVAEYVAEPHKQRVRAWIAERDGTRAGCVSCARQDAETAQLRVLLVEPEARGQGLGARLVDECLSFARAARYRRIVLMTYDVLTEARRIYQRAGFVLSDERPEHAFGHDLVAQMWARDLDSWNEGHLRAVEPPESAARAAAGA